MWGGGGVDRALLLDPPPKKKGSIDGPRKIDLQTSVIPMAVVFVFQDTRSAVNFSYTCMWCPTMASHENHMS